MSLFIELLDYGKEYGRPVQYKDNNKKINKIAQYFSRLAHAKRYYIENGKNNKSYNKLTCDMDHELIQIFGPTWHETRVKSWTYDNQYDWLDSFIKSKQLKADDWYNIKVKDFVENDATGLISKYDSCVKKIIDVFGPIFYPAHEFYEWKFGRVITWEIPYKNDCQIDLDNTQKYELFKEKIMSNITLSKKEIPLFRQFIDYVKNIEKISDIHSLTYKMLTKHGSASLLIGYSLKDILMLAYPEIHIHKYLLKCIDLSHWNNNLNIREALEYYRTIKQLSINDLIKITKSELNANGFLSLTRIGTMDVILSRAYPEIEWDPLEISKICIRANASSIKWCDKHSWSKENRLLALTQISDKENWESYNDYYKLSNNIAIKYNLNGLMEYYGHSPITLLRDLLPEYDWKVWDFSHYHDCWSIDKKINIDMIRLYFEDFYIKHNLKSLDDYTNYVVKDFPQGLLLLFKFNLYKCMKAVYPDHPWEEGKFKVRNYSKSSIKLWKYLTDTIPMLTLQHKLNGGEVKIEKYKVDAYHISESHENALNILAQLPSYCHVKIHKNSKNIIFQYHGTYWHAHPEYYDSAYIHPTRKIECGLIYKETCIITETLFKTHHVVEIWEHDCINNIHK